MNKLLLPVLLLLAGPAFAEDSAEQPPAPPEGQAVDVASQPDASTAFAVAANAYATANQMDPVCSGDCKTKVLKQAKVKGSGPVQVRQFPGGDFDVYAVTLADAQNAWYGVVLGDIRGEDCGAGSCVDQKVTKLTAKLVDDVTWVTVTVKASHVENDSGHVMDSLTYQYVVACKLGAQRCATVEAGGPSSKGSAKISGTQVMVHSSDGDRTVDVAF